MAAYEQINGNTVPVTFNRDETTAYHVAADYKTGDLRFTAGMRGYKLVAGKAATADVRGDTYWGGVSYVIKPAITLTGAVYHVNVKNVAAGQDADPTMYVVRSLYALSKRTDLYAAAAYAKAQERQAGQPVARRCGLRHVADRRHRRHPAPLLSGCRGHDEALASAARRRAAACSRRGAGGRCRVHRAVQAGRRDGPDLQAGPESLAGQAAARCA